MDGRMEGWHLCSLTISLNVKRPFFDDSPISKLGMEIKSWFVWQLYMCLSSMASESSNFEDLSMANGFFWVYMTRVPKLIKKNNIYVLLWGGFGFQRRSKWLPIESQLSPTLADIAWCRGETHSNPPVSLPFAIVPHTSEQRRDPCSMLMLKHSAID